MAYNFDTMRFFSGRRGLVRLAIVILSFTLAGAGAIYLDRYRKVPIERAINPVYWVRHWRGLDRYDAAQALLEHGDPGVPEVALTIDDGPDPRYGPAIARYLHDSHIPAT